MKLAYKSTAYIIIGANYLLKNRENLDLINI